MPVGKNVWKPTGLTYVQKASSVDFCQFGLSQQLKLAGKASGKSYWLGKNPVEQKIMQNPTRKKASWGS